VLDGYIKGKTWLVGGVMPSVQAMDLHHRLSRNIRLARQTLSPARLAQRDEHVVNSRQTRISHPRIS